MSQQPPSKWVGVPEGSRPGPPQMMGARRPPPPSSAPPPRSAQEEGRASNTSPARAAPPARPPPARIASSPGGVTAAPPAASPSAPRGRGPSGLIAPPARRLPPSRAGSEEPGADTTDAARKAMHTRTASTQEMARPDALPAPLPGARGGGRGRGRGGGAGTPAAMPNPKNIPPPRAPPPRTQSQSKFPVRAAPPPPIAVTPPADEASPQDSPQASPHSTGEFLRGAHGVAPPSRPRPASARGVAPVVLGSSPGEKEISPRAPAPTAFEKAKPRVAALGGNNKISPQRSQASPERGRPAPFRPQLSSERIPRGPNSPSPPTTPTPSPTPAPMAPATPATPAPAPTPTTVAPVVAPRKLKPAPPVAAPPTVTASDSGSSRDQVQAMEKTFIATCQWGLHAYGDNPNVSREERARLFANLEEIVAAHQAVGEAKAGSSASEFLFALIPKLKLYLPYIANLSSAFLLAEQLREQGVFSSLSAQSYSLEAILERPKQYLESYPAVIAGLAERSDPTTEPGQFDKLMEVALAFESIQRQVKKRDTLPKHLTRLWDIEQSFAQDENLQFGESRELYLEGMAREVGAGEAEGSLRVFMFAGLIIVAKPVNGYTLQSVIKASPEQLVVRDLGGTNLQFESHGQSLQVAVPSAQDKTRWMNFLPVQYPNGRHALRSPLLL